MARALIRRAFVVLLASMPIVEAAPSRAECIRGNVAVHRKAHTDLTVLSDTQCLVPTPWPVVVDVHADESEDGVPPGTPNGVRVDLWVPAP